MPSWSASQRLLNSPPDDIAAQTAGPKATGVVINETATTPRYGVGLFAQPRTALGTRTCSMIGAVTPSESKGRVRDV